MGFPSLYRLYMETGDITEYTFATTYLGGWSHWLELSSASWFKPYIDAWRTELETKIKSDAVKGIREEAASESKGRLTALKFLAEGGWKAKPVKSGVGRTTQDKIKREAERLSQVERDILEDHERMN